MKTMVTFVSDDSFNKTQQKPGFINPNNFGDDMLLWLRDEIRARHFEADDEPGQEDFGWYLNFVVDGVSYCVVCGLEDPDDADCPNCSRGVQHDHEVQKWIMWIERNVGFWKSIFGQRDKNISRDAINLVDECLKGHPGISQIHWTL